MADSPTQRTLNMLRESGATAETVERRNWFAGPPHMKCPACGKNKIGRTNDLFECIDIVSLRPGHPGIDGWQATSGVNHTTRRWKILTLPAAKLWVECGNRLFVISWDKRKVEGMAKLMRWQPRIEEVTVGMFEETLGCSG